MAGRPVSESSKKLGARMKQILQDLRITQTDAAFQLGLNSQAALNNYLLGKNEIPINIVEEFHNKFHVPMNILWGSEPFSADNNIDIPPELKAKINLVFKNWLKRHGFIVDLADKTKILSHIYKQDCRDTKSIEQLLSTWRAANSSMFIKGK